MFPFAPGARFPFRPSALLGSALLLGAPLAADTFSGPPCIYQLGGQSRFLLRTASGALMTAPTAIPAHLLAACPPALGTPASAWGILLDPSWQATEACHVAYRGKGGALHHIGLTGRQAGRNEGGTWHEGPLNGPGSGAGPAAGDPDLLAHGNAFHVVYRDTLGGLVDLPLAGKPKAALLNRPGLTQAPAAGGDPVQLVVAGVRNVFFTGRDGVVWRLWEEGHGWDFRQLSNGGSTDAPAAGGPLTVFQAGNRVVVVYPDRSARIVALTLDAEGRAWKDRLVTREGEGFAPASLTARDRVACRPLEGTDGDFRAAYRTSDGRLIHLRVGPEDVATQQLNAGGLTRGVRAESGPAFLPHPAGAPGCLLQYVDEEGQLTQLACADGSDKGWAPLHRIAWSALPKAEPRPAGEHKAGGPAPMAAAAGSPTAKVPAPARPAADATAQPTPSPAPDPERPRGPLFVWLGKQQDDLHSRMQQGKVVGEDLKKMGRKLGDFIGRI